MPAGSPSFLVDSRTNVANIATQHELAVAETYPSIQPSYWQSITAESGGTQLESIECARLVIGSVSGNHLMFIGGLDANAPFSGRGLPLYPGAENEREMFIENSNRIRICASFSGEMIYYMGYVAGSPTSMNPAVQGSQPNNMPPVLIRTDPLDRQESVSFQGSGITFRALFDEDIASGTVDVSSFSIRLSGNFITYLSGETSYYQPEDATDRTHIQFIPYSGQLQGSSWYTVFIGQRIADDFGSTINNTLTWSFLTAGIDDSPMFLKTNSPISGTVLAPFSQTIEAVFSKRISGTLNATGYTNNIYLWSDNTSPTVGVSGLSLLDGDSSGLKLIFTPDFLLNPATIYRYSITGVTDLFSITATPKSGVAFTTGPADFDGPVVSGVSPSAYPNHSGLVVGLSGVSTLTNIVVTFDERLSGIPGGTISGQCISLVNSGDTGTNLSGTITLSASGNVLTFDPVAELISGTMYQIRISGVIDVNGNFITQTNPTISGIAFVTWTEADVAPPVVQSITPLSGTVGVAVNTNIVVTFNETLSGTHPASPFTAIVGLNLSGTGAIAGTASTNSSGTVVTFDPTADLSGDRVYSVSVSGALDLASNQMNPVSGHTFRTIDNIAPLVSGITPISGTVDVATNTNIVITLSEASSGTAGGSVIAGVVRLYKSGVPGTSFAGTRTLDATRTVLTFDPNSDLDQNEHYQVSVSGILDVSGNQLSPTISGHSFVTQAGPVITATTPVSGQIDVALGTNIVVSFNKALSGTANGTVAAGVFKLWVSSATPSALPGVNTLNSDRTQLTFNPNSDLTDSKIYVWAVSGVYDLSGAQFSQTSPPSSGFTFTTLSVDSTPPTITSTSPASGDTGVLTTTTYAVNFSETISGSNGQTMPSYTVKLVVSGQSFASQSIAGTVTKTDDAQLTFTPSANLSGDRWYRASVTGVYDLAENRITQTNPPRSGIGFRTVDNIPPTVTSINPSSGSTGFIINNNITVTMSETCSGTAGGSISAGVISLVKTATPSTQIPGAITLNGGRTIFTFNPTGNLDYSTEYQVRVSGIRDQFGDNFVSPTVSGHSFTTESLPLTPFYENTGSTEHPWNNFNPDVQRVGVLREASQSILNGKVIKRASFKLKRTGSSSSNISLKIWVDTAEGNGQASIITLTTKPFNDVPTGSPQRVVFDCPNNTHAMSTDDIIGIEWTNSSPSVTLSDYYSGDQTDGSFTQYANHNGNNWNWFSSRDLDAKLEG